MATCLVLTSVLGAVGCGGEDTGQGGNGGNGNGANGGNGGAGANGGNGGAGANGGGGGTGGDPLPAKPTTRFEDTASTWTLPLGGQHKAGFNDLSGEPGSGEDVSFGSQRWRVTDIDGNGTPDLVVPSTAVPRAGYYFWNEVPGYKDEKPFWYVYKNKGTGFEEGPIPWFVPAGGQHKAGFNDLSGEPGSGEDVSFGSQRWRLTDIDGNGTPDLVVTATAVPREGYYYWSEVPGYKDGKPFWYVYKNTGSGFEEGPVPWFVPVGGQHKAGFNDLSGEPGSGEDVSFGSQRWRLTDIDADGKPDLVVTATAVPREGYYFWSEVPGQKDGKPFWYVYKNNGSGFEQNPIPWFVPVGGKHKAGFNDLSGEPGSGEDVSFGSQRWRLSDIDGDGKSDLVVPSTAVPREGYYFWNEVPGYNDGKPFWYVYKNNGAGFEQGPVPWFVPVGGQHEAGFNDLSGEPGSGEDVSFGSQRWRTIDLTSDGKPDLVVPSTAVPRNGYYFWNEVPGYDDGKPFWYVYKNNGAGYDEGPVPWFVPVGGQHKAGFNDLSGEPGSGEDVSFGSDRWRLTDLDGDARLDLVITGEAQPRNGYYFWVEVEGYNTAPLWQVYRGAP